VRTVNVKCVLLDELVVPTCYVEDDESHESGPAGQHVCHADAGEAELTVVESEEKGGRVDEEGRTAKTDQGEKSKT
jgi:hypothetical protein